jgi:hypothetical protein
VPVVVKAWTGISVASPAVAVAGSGDVIVAWQQQHRSRTSTPATNRLMVRRGNVSRRFGAVQQLDRSGWGESVATLGAGSAAVAWQPGSEHASIKVSVARGRERFGPAQTLATGSETDSSGPWPLDLLAARGRYVAVWWEQVGEHGSVYYAISNGAGRFAPARLLGQARPDAFVSAAVAPDGVVTAAWYLPSCGCPDQPSSCPQCATGRNQLAYAQLGRHANAFGTTHSVGAVASDSLISGVSVSAGRGGTALAWTETPVSLNTAQTAARETTVIGSAGQSPPVTSDPAPTPTLVRALLLTHRPHSTPETVYTLAPHAAATEFVQAPVMALAGRGTRPTAVWVVEDQTALPNSNTMVAAAGRRSDGTYGPLKRLSAPRSIPTAPVTVATNSSTVVVWQTGVYGMFRLHYAVRSTGEPFSVDRLLAAGDADAQPVMASAPHAVVAAWDSRSRTGHMELKLAILRN